MNKQRFLTRRRPVWKRFEQLLHEHMQTAREVREFSRLLRELSNDLAIIRSRDWGQGLVSYLNDLVARGHNAFYRAAPSDWQRLVTFLMTGFPRLFRANVGYFAVAAALFFVPLGVTWAVVQTDPTAALKIIPSEQLEMFDAMYRSQRDREEQAAAEGGASSTKPEEAPAEELDEEGLESGFGEERTAMAGFYVQHNVGIALQCFARGLLLGWGTIHTLLFNGITIGAVAGYILSLGYAERFLSFVVSHGSFELTAIAIAGGAGLMLGDALIHPGQRTRVEALRVRGLEAVQIAGGAAAMLVVAALIEAFWSPAPIPPLLKYLVGTGLWLLVAVYLTFAGREVAGE